jgi:hypothetical protein
LTPPSLPQSDAWHVATQHSLSFTAQTKALQATPSFKTLSWYMPTLQSDDWHVALQHCSGVQTPPVHSSSNALRS